jgi:hypothetical protein
MQSLFSLYDLKENFFFICLYSLDNAGHDDDFIFEEFARIRLKGHESGHDDTEA